MAAAYLTQINNEFLKCPVCYEDADRPKVLPCLHSFCLKCLEKLVDGESKHLACPQCRQEVELPEAGVGGLQDNFFVSDLAETMSNWKSVEDNDNQPVCSGCAGGDHAHSRCLTCMDFLCDGCVGIHKKLRLFRDHCVVTLEELRSGQHADSLRVKLEPLRCDQHEGETLRFYCTKCEVAICRDCTVLDHPKPDHPFINIREAVQKQREDLKMLLEKNSAKVKEFQAAVSSVEKSLETLANNRQKVEDDIQRFTEALKAKIDNNRAELLRQVKDHVSTKDKQLQAKNDGLQLDLCKLTSACELTENILEVGTDWEIVSLHQQLAKRMQELEKTALEEASKELRVLQHISLNENVIAESTNLIGAIDTANPPPEPVAEEVGEPEVQP